MNNFRSVDISLKNFGGISTSITKVGDYAYIGKGRRGLSVFDVSSPNEPILVKKIDNGFDYQFLLYEQGLLYVCSASDGLLVFSISDPINPQLLRQVDTPGEASKIISDSGYLYLADGTNGLLIYDIVDPSNPIELGGYPASNSVLDLAISGNTLYLGDVFEYIIVDITNKASPSLLGGPHYIPASNPFLFIEGHSMFGFASSSQTLHPFAYNVSNPSSPSLVSSSTLYRSTLSNMKRVENYLYVSYSYAINIRDPRASGIEIFDITNPLSPTSSGYFYSQAGCSDLFVEGSYIYCASYEGGVEVFDQTMPTSAPVQIGGYDSGSRDYDIGMSGNFLYTASYANGLIILDASIPSNLTVHAQENTVGSAYRLHVGATHVYVLDYISNLHIVNVSDTTNPLSNPINESTYSGTFLGVTVNGTETIAYLSSSSGIEIIDISDKANPTLITTFTDFSSVTDPIWSANNLYVGSGTALQILDVSVPSSPTVIGFVNLSGSIVDIESIGSYIVASTSAGIEIIDVSDTFSPNVVGSLSIPGFSHKGLAVKEDSIIIGGFSEFSIIDMSDKTDPKLAFRSDVPHGIAEDIIANSTHFFMANNLSGTRAFSFSELPGQNIGINFEAGEITDIIVSDDKLYYSDNVGGFGIANYRTSDFPLSELRHKDTRKLDIAFERNRIYTADAELGFSIYDITNISSPELIGQLAPPGGFSPMKIVVRDSIVYGSFESIGIRIYDTSTPSSLTQIGSLGFKGNEALFIFGDYLYGADGNNGVGIANISDPSSPLMLGQFDTTGFANDIVANDSYVFVADGSNGLVILDASDKNNLIQKNIVNVGGTSTALALSDNILFVGVSTTKELHVYDVSNPTSLQLLGTYGGLDTIYSMAIERKRLYLNLSKNGIIVYDFTNPLHLVTD
ncbi:MAG: hypothetical protein H6622_09490 [Halobacteriovoraceae bacterium]|nr:hypothetical protein [Halobacteriovoraceae bacterium]